MDFKKLSLHERNLVARLNDANRVLEASDRNGLMSLIQRLYESQNDVSDLFQSSQVPCSMGVGCDEAGVCYASAHDQPEKCGRGNSPRREARIEELRKGLLDARDGLHVISHWSALDAAKVECVKTWIADANDVLNGGTCQ